MFNPDTDLLTATSALEALRDRRIDAFALLLHDDVELHTACDVLRGRDAVRAWAAQRRFEHLDVELGPASVIAAEQQFMATYPVRLRWRENGELVNTRDESVEICVRDARVARLRLQSGAKP